MDKSNLILIVLTLIIIILALYDINQSSKGDNEIKDSLNNLSTSVVQNISGLRQEFEEELNKLRDTIYEVNYEDKPDISFLILNDLQNLTTEEEFKFWFNSHSFTFFELATDWITSPEKYDWYAFSFHFINNKKIPAKNINLVVDCPKIFAFKYAAIDKMHEGRVTSTLPNRLNAKIEELEPFNVNPLVIEVYIGIEKEKADSCQISYYPEGAPMKVEGWLFEPTSKKFIKY